MSWIVVGAIACLGLVMALVLFETRQEIRELDAKAAELVARHLELQRLRIDASYDTSNRFPDWDAIAGPVSADGQCVRFEDETGRLLRSNCVGSNASRDAIPPWFAALHRLLFSFEMPAERDVSYRDRTYGTVLVTSDPGAAMARTWREMKHMLGLTAITVLFLCLLVYFAIDRALAPTKVVVAGLNRLADGDFTFRLPRFGLSELQRIGEVTNQLAGKIETTLSERALLSRRLVNAQEQERRHLARELHDEFAQNLAAISALAASLEKSAQQYGSDLSIEAQTLSRISMRTMTSLRETLLHLRPADLDEFGLTESLRQLVAVWNTSSRQGAKFELDASRDVGPLPDDAAIHIFRIAQEGLTNAARHADAKHVRLSLAPLAMAPSESLRGRGVLLEIEDDGKGRRESRRDGPDAAGRGMGILNMRERVAALGGSIDFDDRREAGLTVRVMIPVGPAEEQTA